MAQIEFKYFILDCDEVVFESTAQAKLTKKELKESETFIVEHNYSPEFVDIPGNVYQKCLEKAFEKAINEYSDINERYEELEVVLEQYLPVSLIMQLSDELKLKMLTDEPYYMDESEIFPSGSEDTVEQAKGNEVKNEKDESVEVSAVSECKPVSVEPDSVEPESVEPKPAETVEEIATDGGDTEGEEVLPTKENTLYLPIKQIYFDEIIEGTKKEEYREIKPTTYKKYLKCDAKGNPFVDTSLIDMNDPLCGDINVWNNGVYPLMPNENHRFLHLAVGYNKERDEAIVEIKDVSFEPALNENGLPIRFDEEDDRGFECENGKLCIWIIVYHLGRIVNLKRAVKGMTVPRPKEVKKMKQDSHLKTLSLQIKKENFDTILNGTQKVEHRYIYPSNESRYVRYLCEGKEYKKLYDTPDNDSPIETIPVEYDALYLINGRRKDAPRLTVEIVDAEVVRIVDEDGNDITYEENGLVYSQCQIWYYLGEIISTENI